ncbi:MAG: hypothetical protein JXR03_06450 [Cyclobacteriaceae bacterium]
MTQLELLKSLIPQATKEFESDHTQNFKVTYMREETFPDFKGYKIEFECRDDVMSIWDRLDKVDHVNFKYKTIMGYAKASSFECYRKAVISMKN